MKKVLFIIMLGAGITTGFAQSNGTYPYTDAYGNHYKSAENLYKDSDGDGVINLYDRHDKNPNIKYSNTPDYSHPSYYNNYRASYYDAGRGRTIYVGPRGGHYYINSNGNKVYIRK